jgi:hypothetical protein
MAACPWMGVPGTKLRFSAILVVLSNKRLYASAYNHFARGTGVTEGCSFRPILKAPRVTCPETRYKVNRAYLARPVSGVELERGYDTIRITLLFWSCPSKPPPRAHGWE